MLKPGTLFVIGAGVSAELGLPLGQTLTKEIAGLLPQGSRGSNNIRLAASNSGEDYDTVARRLAAAMPLAASIDNLIEHSLHDARMVDMAKYGIAEAILLGERSSTLFVSDEKPGMPSDQQPHSLLDIFRLMVSGVARDDLQLALNRVSFVTFNYDRTLEHFLTWAAVAYSGITREAATRIVEGMKIHHPYGSLGDLRTVRFGQRPAHTDVREAASNIRTFSEEIRSGAAETARSLMAEASRVIFLGCAHHRQNMQLLAPPEFGARNVYGTVYNVPPADPLGFSQPAMAQFAEPAIDAFKHTVGGWPRAGSLVPLTVHGTNFEPVTSRQLIARYGPEWLA